MSNLVEESFGGVEMTEAEKKSPCGQLSAANGVWYVAAGRLCFGSAVHDLLESPPFSPSDSVLFFCSFNSPVLETVTAEKNVCSP